MHTLAGRIDGLARADERCLIELEEGGSNAGVLRAHDGVIDPTAVRPADYHLVASCGSDGALDTVDVALLPGAARSVRLTPTGPGAVRVHVVRFPRGGAVENAQCSGYGRAGGPTDAAGTGTVGGLPPGRRWIECHAGLAEGSAVAEVVEGATVDARVSLVLAPDRSVLSHDGADLDDRTFPPAFVSVARTGPASAAGIANGELLLAIDGVELTVENIEAAATFMRVAAEAFTARVRSKAGSYAIELTVTPR